MFRIHSLKTITPNMSLKVETEHLNSLKPGQLKHMIKNKLKNMEPEQNPKMMKEKINFLKQAPNIGKQITIT